MFDNKYKKILTIVLVIAIILIIGLLIFLGIDIYKKKTREKEASTAIEEFNKYHGIDPDNNQNDDEDENGTEIPDIDQSEIPEIIPSQNGSGTTTGGGSSSGKPYTYKGFVMLGYIKLPSTKEIPILESVTKKSLENGVVLLYSTTGGKLNEPGNVVIAGHNYRNQTFFSNNKKLKEGDKIYITDETGRKLTYVVYKNFETTPEDTSFYARKTNGATEITLSTCTSDVKKRTIIFAKAQ